MGFDANVEILEKLWLRWLELGRDPKADELEFVDEIKESFGTIGQALSFLLWFHDKAIVEEASKIRKEDLLVILALEEFHQRKPYKELEKSLQRDLKHYFGSPTEARKQAKELLFQIADDLIDFKGDSKIVGKPTKRDKQNGKPNLVNALGYGKTFIFAKNLKNKINKKIKKYGNKSKDLLQSVEFILNRKF